MKNTGDLVMENVEGIGDGKVNRIVVLRMDEIVVVLGMYGIVFDEKGWDRSRLKSEWDSWQSILREDVCR